ncbi:MAG: hypothetical protein M1587_04705 [Thaumarchaeota archaeon]|nr:hypothetical protein [Nitrososphaerota archaeon]
MRLSPRRRFILLCVAVGILEGLFALIGDALVKDYGLIGGFMISTLVGMLMYYTAVVGDKSMNKSRRRLLRWKR